MVSVNIEKTRPDVCLSLGNLDSETVLSIIKSPILAEIRMDLLPFSDSIYQQIFETNTNLIATYRSSDYDLMSQKLLLAIEWGAAYIDLGLETPLNTRNILIKKAQEKHCKVILSFHDFKSTPQLEDLSNIVNQLFNSRADIVKVATLANSPNDNAKILALYASFNNLIALCMGDCGKITRFAAPLVGAPFTYACIEKTQTALGQVSYKECVDFLNKYRC